MSVRYSRRPGPAIQVIGKIADQAAYRVAQKVRGRVIRNIHARGRIDTGKMVAGVQVRVMARMSYGAAYQVYSTAVYTGYQEFGTRAHGPRVAKVMVFTPKGGGAKVFTTWVRGVTPGNFFRDAYRDTKASDALP